MADSVDSFFGEAEELSVDRLSRFVQLSDLVCGEKTVDAGQIEELQSRSEIVHYRAGDVLEATTADGTPCIYIIGHGEVAVSPPLPPHT